jgi:hypothetical protein
MFKNNKLKIIKEHKDIVLIGSFLIFLLTLTVYVSAFNFPTSSVKVYNYGTGSGGNVTNFTQLLDVPSSYSGQANKCVAVNSGASGLSFVDCSGAGSFVPYTGATTTVNLNGQALTNIGALIVAGLTTTQNLVPTTNNLYSLGNSTNRYLNIYGTNIYGERINSTNITSQNINSTNIASQSLNSNVANISTNLTIGGHKVSQDNGNLSITLG